MLRQNQAVSPEEMEQSVTVLLSLRALETGALNENSTVAAIDRTWQKNTESISLLSPTHPLCLYGPTRTSWSITKTVKEDKYD